MIRTDLDGEDNYYYAATFAQLYKTLTADQKTKLAALRKSILSGTYSDGTTFDLTICTTYFLYSDPITDTTVLTPYIGDTDYLFFELFALQFIQVDGPWVTAYPFGEFQMRRNPLKSWHARDLCQAHHRSSHIDRRKSVVLCSQLAPPSDFIEPDPPIHPID
jgi:hypothetical protein